MDKNKLPSLPEGKTAADIYKALSKTREGVLREAQRLSEITIPSVFPPDGTEPADVLGTQNQGINASAINSLTSALQYAGFPPNLPFVKYNITQTALEASQKVKDDPKLISLIKGAVVKRANAHRVRAASTPLRGTYSEYTKQLLIGGNACFDYTEIDTPVVHRMDKYVVLRDDKGRQLLVIVEKMVLRKDLPEEVLQDLEATQGLLSEPGAPQKDSEKAWYEDSVKVHRVCMTDENNYKTYHLWEEVDGIIIEDTRETWKGGVKPLHAAWLIPSFGSNWGRSYAQEYRGDHFFVENLGSAVQDMAAALALTLITVIPGGMTKTKDVKEARNLDVISGRLEDIGAVQFGKSGDLSAVAGLLSDAERRLGRAYLSTFSIQRDAERVTKAEWMALQRELEKAMGTIYAFIGTEVLLPVVMQFIKLHDEEENSDFLDRFSKLINVGVVTGADSLGQDIDTDNLREYRAELNELMTPQIAATKVDDDEVAKRLAVGRNIPTEGLLKDPERQAQESESQKQDALMQQAAPGMMQDGAKALMQGMMAQQQQPAPEQP